MKNLSGVKNITLSTGTKLVFIPTPGYNSVYIHAWFRCGSAYESRKNNGISHFLEHLVFRGNQKLGSPKTINSIFEHLGGEINASTSTQFMEFWLHYHKNFLDQGIINFCQLLFYPLFKDLELERSIILEEIKEDYNENGALIDLESLSEQELWGKQNYGLPIIGSEEIIKTISLQQIEAWHAKFFFPGNLILGIFGDVNPDSISKIIDNELLDIKNKSEIVVPSPQFDLKTKNKLLMVPDEDNQFRLQWTFSLENIALSDRIKFYILSRILDDGFGSLLQQEIREKRGLVYEISANISFIQDKGMFSIECTVSREKMNALCFALDNLITDMVANSVSIQSFQLALKRSKLSLDLLADYPDSLLYNSVKPLLDPQTPDAAEMKSLLQQIQFKDVQGLIQRLFIKKNNQLVIVGPFTEESTKSVQESFIKWR